MSVAVVVLSTLYPSDAQPTAGLFIQERMSRVAGHLPVIVVSPQPWFPGQGLLQRLRPGYRPGGTRFERRAGVDVYRPRFLALPLLGRSMDSLSMALCSLPLVRRLRRQGSAHLIDAHFGYPDGHAACLLARWLHLPFTVTLRGTEPRIGRTRLRARLQRRALQSASKVVGVAGSLTSWARGEGVPEERLQVIGNGVDTERFRPIPRDQARRELGLPTDARVLITVGGLTERKGFHRVIEILPELLKDHPNLHYLIVGGASGEGDWGARLQAQVRELDLGDHVHFQGVVAPEALHARLSAADVFVLATRNEGWANVLLEAMACGLPVVTTDVGGNKEVVCDESLGTLVPLGDGHALKEAIRTALLCHWDYSRIRAYAEVNGWERRVSALVTVLSEAATRRQHVQLNPLQGR